MRNPQPATNVQDLNTGYLICEPPVLGKNVVDISELTIGDVLRVSDLPVIEGVEYTDDPEAGIVTVSVPAAVISEEVEDELLEGEEGEEGAEPGEEGAEGAAEGAEDSDSE